MERVVREAGRAAKLVAALHLPTVSVGRTGVLSNAGFALALSEVLLRDTQATQ